MSLRGVMIAAVRRSSMRKTRETSWCSCSSNTPGFGALLHQHADLLFADGRGFATARLPRSRSIASVAKLSNRTIGYRDDSHVLHRFRDEARDRLRVEQREPLRHELADDERADRDARDHDRHGNHVGVGRDERPLRQPRGNVGRQRGLAESAARDADHRDADLDRREEVAGVVGKLERRAGGGVPFFVKLLQARFPGGHDGHLGHREKAVDEEQEQQYEELHGGLESGVKKQDTALLAQPVAASVMRPGRGARVMPGASSAPAVSWQG